MGQAAPAAEKAMEVREDTVASRVQDLYDKFKPAPEASKGTLSVILAKPFSIGLSLP